MERKLGWRALLLTALTLIPLSAVRADTVVLPRRTQGLTTSPAPGTTVNLINLVGPGKFLTANLSKQGGASDLTFVILDIDGQNVVNTSIAGLRNAGLTEANSAGIVLLDSAAGLDTVTIGFPETLTYQRSLRLAVTVQEAGVVQILANVIHAQ
jgi:hypothetical protein